MKNLLVTLLLGLSLVGLVGCGTAPETTIETVIEKGEQAIEIVKHDTEIIDKEKVNELEEDSELYLTDEEWELLEDEFVDDYTMKLMSKIKLGLGEKELSNDSQSDLRFYEEDFDLLIELGTNSETQIVKANKKVEEEPVVEEENNQSPEIEEKAPVQQTKKESQYLVDVITKSEAYTWDLYDIITKGGDLQQVSNICAEMIDLLEGVTMEDCEYEGEFYAVQSLKDSYLNMVTTIGPATMHGIDVSADLPDAYNKINNDTLFLVNELNN